MKTFIFTCVCLLSALVASNAGDKDSDLDRLQGVWQVVSLTEKGKAIPAEETAILEIVIDKDTFTAREKGEIVVQYQMKLDPEKKPKAVDFTHLIGENKGKTELGIYLVEKDQIKLCVDETRKGRPAVFEGKETEAFSVIVLKRKEVKDAK